MISSEDLEQYVDEQLELNVDPRDLDPYQPPFSWSIIEVKHDSVPTELLTTISESKTKGLRAAIIRIVMSTLDARTIEYLRKGEIVNLICRVRSDIVPDNEGDIEIMVRSKKFFKD